MSVRRWMVLTVQGPSGPSGPSGEAAELLPEGLVLLGARGVEQTEEGTMRVYLPEPSNVEEFLAKVEGAH